MSPVSLTEATRYWLTLGCISFGGPAGQIALMHQDLVERKRWISEARFLHALNYCMLLPGPEAQQLATYIGWLMHGRIGGLIAGSLFVLPSFALLVLLSWLYLAYGTLPIIHAILYGIKPAVVALVLAAAWRIGQRTVCNRWLGAIAVSAFIAITFLHMPFPVVIASAALIGWLGGKYQPHYFSKITQHPTPHAATPSAATSPHPAPALTPPLIDDHTRLPHTAFSVRQLILLLITGLLVWAGVLLGLSAGFGAHSPLTQMGWFFTKAALLTFGGAYAVLPYVYQGAVQQFGWLSATQMMDGLALGETTPGPLIMIVTFVGFAGGWNTLPLNHTISTPALQWWGALSAASVTTFFTFLPSFLFIFAGAPLIERSQHNLRLTAPLTAITAAVVGVILNLAVFFAGHVFWPQGVSASTKDLMQGLDGIAVVMTLLAALALLRFKINPLWVIGAAACAGLIVQ